MALPKKYQLQWVAFIDILGFANMVDKIDTDERVFDQIMNFNSTIETAVSEAATLVGGMLDVDVKWTAFSDSIVISVPITVSRTLCLYTAVHSAQALSRALLTAGALTRGGIAQGPLYHEEGAVFGAGMISAYHLERDVAKVARIVVEPAIAKEWWNYYGKPGGLTALRDLIRTDADKIPYVDLFHFPEHDSIDRHTYDFFQRCGPVLQEKIREPGVGLPAWAKIAWLAREYNESGFLRRCRNLKPIDMAGFAV